MKPDLEIYIHIPFCEKKCNYCDFLSFKADARCYEEYVSQLKKELAVMSTYGAAYTVSSVFVGGGTPSLLPAYQISGLMECIREYFDLAKGAEITIECNPGSIMRHKLTEYKKAGINRLSIGLQSADNAELKLLGRIHTFEEFLNTYQSARMEGFDNINVDLIDCIPMQSINTWRRTLRTVTMLKPEHISVYNLIIEPGTPFYEMNAEGVLMMPSEDEQSRIDEYTRTYMKRMGYERYEFSNWSKPGRECRHNLGYWQGVPYLGFGLGAASYFEGFRWNNTSDMNEYMSVNEHRGHLPDNNANDADYVGKAYGKASDKVSGEAESCADAFAAQRKDLRKLTREDKMEEFMFLGLRCTRGISEANFYGRFGLAVSDVYGAQLAKYTGLGLIEHAGGMYRLTERGIEVSNVILSEFLLDKKQEPQP